MNGRGEMPTVSSLPPVRVGRNLIPKSFDTILLMMINILLLQKKFMVRFTPSHPSVREESQANVICPWHPDH